MDEDYKNIAATLAEVLPKPEVMNTIDTGVEGYKVAHIAVPKTMQLQEVKVDLEPYMPHPRHTKAVATFSDIASFLAYIARHRNDGSVVWCDFNPQTFALSFTAVIDEHVAGRPAWRMHRAQLVPAMSSEWKAWKGADKQSTGQVEFAEFLQEHEDDIAVANGMPSSADMHKMATEFVMNEERVLKSSVRLQSGGVRLTYVADPDKGTTETMQMFEKFALGIPVFHGGSAWSLTARLKYRQNGAGVKFHYELVRADRVHDGAAKELIEQIRAGLAGVPMLMGACS